MSTETNTNEELIHIETREEKNERFIKEVYYGDKRGKFIGGTAVVLAEPLVGAGLSAVAIAKCDRAFGYI